MKKQIKYLFGLLLFVSVLCFVVLSIFNSNSKGIISDNINYKAVVCIMKNDKLISCRSNLLYNTGKNMIRDMLALNSSVESPIYISLCNATAGCGTPVVDGSETFNEITTCGLQKVDGTLHVWTTDGKWSIVKQFTSTCDNVMTNVTRLGNSTTNFAGATFTTTTLDSGDKLTVNWTISVT